MVSVSLYRIPDADLSDDVANEIVWLEEGMWTEVALKEDLPGRLFVFQDPPEVPEWVQYISPLVNGPVSVPTREPAGAILLLKPNARQRIVYAAAWGTGRFQLRSLRLESDGGLRCALNLISGEKQGDRAWDSARVRAIRSKRVGENTLIIETQASRKAAIDAFPFSIQADQLRRVTGTPTNTSKFGSNISGGVALRVKRPDDPGKLIALCREIERVHKSTDYQRHFGWIDNVAPVKDVKKLDAIYELIVASIRAGRLDEFSLSPPTLVSWEEVTTFSYQWGRKSYDVEEPSLASFYEFLVSEDGLMRELTVESLKQIPRLHALDADRARLQSWSVLKCLSGEFRLGGETFVLDDGVLLSVAADYLRDLNAFAKQLPEPSQRFPRMLPGEVEGDYNERLSGALKCAILLDKRTISRPQATAIEICDVATDTRQLVHVKKGTSSSSLSHLFSQGVVSAELLHMDPEFRKKIAKQFSGKIGGSGGKRIKDFAWLHASNFSPHECEVVYAIMVDSRRIKREQLPFFSKVNLRLRCDDLRRMGFKYSLTLIGA